MWKRINFNLCQFLSNSGSVWKMRAPMIIQYQKISSNLLLIEQLPLTSLICVVLLGKCYLLKMRIVLLLNPRYLQVKSAAETLWTTLLERVRVKRSIIYLTKIHLRDQRAADCGKGITERFKKKKIIKKQQQLNQTYQMSKYIWFHSYVRLKIEFSRIRMTFPRTLSRQYKKFTVTLSSQIILKKSSKIVLCQIPLSL